MKNVLLVFLGINCIISCSLITNDNTKVKTAVFKNSGDINDSIRCSDIAINSLKITDTKRHVTSFLGKPDSISTRTDSEDSPEFKYEVLNYGESEFYIHKGILFGFTVNDRKFKFNDFAIGDNIDILEKKYPFSFHNKINMVNNQTIIDCFDSCIYQGNKALGPDRVIITYDEKMTITQIIAFMY